MQYIHLSWETDRYLQKYLDKGLDTIEAKYATLIEGMDKSLGDIMDHLAKKKLIKIPLFFLCLITEV